MDHDLDVLFDQCTTRKHFQELPMLGEVTKKTEASPPTHTPLFMRKYIFCKFYILS